MTLNPLLEPNWMAAIAPEIILSLAGLALILLDAFAPRLRSTFSSMTLVALLSTVLVEWTPVLGDFFGGTYAATPLTRIFNLAFLLAAVLVTMLSHDFLRRQGAQAGEYYALLLWSTVGMMMMAKGTDLLIIILGLELLSICLFVMIGYLRRTTLSSEGSLKYFLMGAFATGFILYGTALFYGQTGSTNVREIGSWIVSQGSLPPIMTVAFVLFMTGVGFKLSLVPFHGWAADVYQGAPTPVAAWLSTAPKAATFLALIHVLAAIAPLPQISAWMSLLGTLAVLSMILGNLVATAQRDLKRMLAYSGIAHVGYMMIAVMVLREEAAAAVAIYAVVYALMNIGAFGVVALLDKEQNEPQTLSDIAGLGFRKPLHGIALTIFMLSLAGIPPTAGFAAKFFVFKVALESGAITVAVIGILTSIVSVYYYLRVVYYMYMREADEMTPHTVAGFLGNGALVAAALGTMIIGVVPGPLFRSAREAARVLFQGP